MIFLGSVKGILVYIRATIYSVLRLISTTCKVSNTKCKKKAGYDKRILSLIRTASLNKISLLNISLGCLASSPNDRFRKRAISHSGKGQCQLCTFFSRIRIRQAKTLTNSLAQSS